MADETKHLTCLTETEHGIAYVTVNAQATVKVIAQRYKISIADAWKMLRQYTYVKMNMSIEYPKGSKRGEMTLPTPMIFPPAEYKVMNPTLVEKCRAFVEKGVEA